MIYGYARASFYFQEADVVIQRAALLDAGCEEIYFDAYTGSETDRPELNILLEKIREGDTIIIYKADRIWRSLTSMMESLVIFNLKKINFISLDATDKINTTEHECKTFLPMCGKLYNIQNTLLYARLQEGRLKAKQAGKKTGRVKGSKNKGTVEKYAKVKLYIKEGKPVNWIATHLGISSSTIVLLRKEINLEEEK